jgi:transcriptional regulator with XRE-family HTH domain
VVVILGRWVRGCARLLCGHEALLRGPGPGRFQLRGAICVVPVSYTTCIRLASRFLIYYTVAELQIGEWVQIPNLRGLRELRGLTQKELSEVSSVSLRSIAGYEGGAHVRPNTARKLARSLNVEVADLVGVDDYPKAPAPPSSIQPPLNGFEEERRESIYQHALRDIIRRLAGRYAAQADDKGYEPAWMLEISEIPRDITQVLFDSGVLGNRETYPTEVEYRGSWEIDDALRELNQAVDRAWRGQMRVSEQMEQRREADQLRELREKREADKGSKEARELEAFRKERRGSA